MCWKITASFMALLSFAAFAQAQDPPVAKHRLLLHYRRRPTLCERLQSEHQLLYWIRFRFQVGRPTHDGTGPRHQGIDGRYLEALNKKKARLSEEEIESVINTITR